MRVITALVIFCLFAVGQAASVQTRTISGTVVDPAGRGIPGVAIELRNGPSAQRRTTSDAAGAWKFERVDAGDYVVRFALAGFVTTDLQLKVGETSPAPARVVLKVGAVSETVTVTGQSPRVGPVAHRRKRRSAKDSGCALRGWRNDSRAARYAGPGSSVCVPHLSPATLRHRVLRRDSMRTVSGWSRTIRSPRSRSTSTPRRTRTSADSSMKDASHPRMPSGSRS